MKRQFYFSLILIIIYNISCNRAQDTVVGNLQDTTPLKEDTSRIVSLPDSAELTKQPAGGTSYEELYKLKNYIVSTITDTSRAYIVKESCALMIQPDSTKIEQMIKEYGEEDFYTVADDNSYYFAEAGTFLTSKKINVVYPAKRYITFKGKRKTITFDINAPNALGWMLLFFDPEKEPEIINTIDVIKEYEAYFGKK